MDIAKVVKLLGDLIEYSEEGLAIDEHMSYRIIEAKKYLREYIETPPIVKTGTMMAEDKTKASWELFYARAALAAFVHAMKYKGPGNKAALMFDARELALKVLGGGE